MARYKTAGQRIWEQTENLDDFTFSKCTSDTLAGEGEVRWDDEVQLADPFGGGVGPVDAGWEKGRR